jgi:hypothetical protein
MDMDRPGSGCRNPSGVPSQLVRGNRQRWMITGQPRTVQARLQQHSADQKMATLATTASRQTSMMPSSPAI